MLDKTFVGRETELRLFRQRLTSDRAELMVLYGRRRVGKTALVQQAFADGEHLYLMADRRADGDLLREFSRRVLAHFDPVLRDVGGFPDWLALLAYIGQRAAERRTVVIIDEFPYLVQANRAVPSLFQKGWDLHLAGSRIYLVLLGSSIAMMETEVLDYRAPLYGRRTGQLLLEPLPFADARELLPDLTVAQQVEFYALTGGTPAYLRQLDPARGLHWNLTERVLAQGSFLNREVEFVLREELREPRVYMSLLKELATGQTRVGELASALGLTRSAVSRYLATLAGLRLVRRELPVTERAPHKSRKGLWRIDDPFFRFHFRYLMPHRAELEQSLGEAVCDRIVADWSSFTAETFETVCTQAVWAMARQGRLPFIPSRVGRWWAGEQEIDIVARDAELAWVLYGECKWQRQPVGAGVLAALRAKVERVHWEAEPGRTRFMLCSRSGFTAGCREAAGDDVLLLDLPSLAALCDAERAAAGQTAPQLH